MPFNHKVPTLKCFFFPFNVGIILTIVNAEFLAFIVICKKRLTMMKCYLVIDYLLYPFMGHLCIVSNL